MQVFTLTCMLEWNTSINNRGNRLLVHNYNWNGGIFKFYNLSNCGKSALVVKKEEEKNSFYCRQQDFGNSFFGGGGDNPKDSE